MKAPPWFMLPRDVVTLRRASRGQDTLVLTIPAHIARLVTHEVGTPYVAEVLGDEIRFRPWDRDADPRGWSDG